MWTMGMKTSGNGRGAVQEQVAKLEKHAANTAAELAAQQDRADALTAHLARGAPGQPGEAQAASSEAGMGGVGGAPSQHYVPTLAPIPGSPSVPVQAQQGLTGDDTVLSFFLSAPLQPDLSTCDVEKSAQ